MNGLNLVEDLARAGRFGAALTTLERLAVTPNIRLSVDVLHAELLERTGRHSQSKAIAERLLKNQNLTLGYRSSCESVLALIEADRDGETGKRLNICSARYFWQRTPRISDGYAGVSCAS